MGWLFGWRTRAELVDHLTVSHGGSYKVLKKFFSGNNLWLLIEAEQGGKTVRTIVLCILRGYGKRDDPYRWGYKDVSEDMGPYYYTCPVSFILSCTEPSNNYAREWREEVIRRAGVLSNCRTGTRLKWRNGVRRDEVESQQTYTIVKRRSPSSFYAVQDGSGIRFHLTKTDIQNMEYAT